VLEPLRLEFRRDGIAVGPGGFGRRDELPAQRTLTVGADHTTVDAGGLILLAEWTHPGGGRTMPT
jgi:hypothetical protein